MGVLFTTLLNERTSRGKKKNERKRWLFVTPHKRSLSTPSVPISALRFGATIHARLQDKDKATLDSSSIEKQSHYKTMLSKNLNAPRTRPETPRPQDDRTVDDLSSSVELGDIGERARRRHVAELRGPRPY
ncbi:hypothetical protein HPB50_005254 [Hyalomma asiaticum]|uniref:Uncharacterized protein n=1 Tax=Hyalomma asiaticum TaxID=266040 RepID=A0ACB7T1E8_HYAAI|nr:hypothetical protein HPB50_005254 [Hyalomma asiaticum]